MPAKQNAAINAWWIDANRTPFVTDISVPEPYTEWTRHRPPSEIPSMIEPDPSLVENRYSYNSFDNITHAGSLALPYYAGPDDYGIFATSNWVEPLGKAHYLCTGLAIG